MEHSFLVFLLDEIVIILFISAIFMEKAKVHCGAYYSIWLKTADPLSMNSSIIYTFRWMLCVASSRLVILLFLFFVFGDHNNFARNSRQRPFKKICTRQQPAQNQQWRPRSGHQVIKEIS